MGALRSHGTGWIGRQEEEMGEGPCPEDSFGRYARGGAGRARRSGVLCRRLGIALAMALVLAPVLARGEEPSSVTEGARVRVTAWSLKLHYASGVVNSLGRDTLTLLRDRGSDLRLVPFSAISRLELSSGRRGHAWAGIGLGLLVGAVAGGAIGAAASEGGEWGDLDVAVGVAGGAVGGMIVGGVVGALIKSERWVRVRRIGDAKVGIGVMGSGRPRVSLVVVRRDAPSAARRYRRWRARRG